MAAYRSACTTLRGVTSSWVKMPQGLCQGCLAWPLLWNFDTASRRRTGGLSPRDGAFAFRP
eukprot:7926907-Prorocentrum_lima.AAC.1